MNRSSLVRFIPLCVLLLVASSTVGISSPFSLDRAIAGKQCKGAKRSPERIKVSTAQRVVVCLINKRRAKRGLKPLKYDPRLSRAATRHTRYMQSRNCFSHACPGEADLPGRLVQADYLPCNCNWGAAENLAWGKGKGRGSPAAVVKAWMNSSQHRPAILSSGSEHAGVGFRRGSPFSNASSLGTYTIDFGFKR